MTGDTRSVRVEEELEAGGNGCSAESALVDQMEELKGVGADQRLRALPRRDAVGAVGELEGQECRESLVGTSQMDEAELNSGQLC